MMAPTETSLMISTNFNRKRHDPKTRAVRIVKLNRGVFQILDLNQGAYYTQNLQRKQRHFVPKAVAHRFLRAAGQVAQCATISSAVCDYTKDR